MIKSDRTESNCERCGRRLIDTIDEPLIIHSKPIGGPIKIFHLIKIRPS
jgi:hypothetical protein